MDLFGYKWTIILAEFGYIFYIAANIKPIPILMYISQSNQTKCFSTHSKYHRIIF